MRTPKDYVQYIEKGMITSQMLSDCLYSVNKRAKNYRDAEQRYRHKSMYNRFWFDRYDQEHKNREKKEECYRKKDKLLSIVSPICIHREECIKIFRRRDYEPEYGEIKAENVVKYGEYYDRETESYVSFVDARETEYRYYLFYDLNHGLSFHTPIRSIEGYDLPVVDIGALETFGSDIDDLISVQFVDKVLSLIESGQYTYVGSLDEDATITA